MDKVHQLRWNDFVASMTYRDVFQEWLAALSHCEKYRAEHPERELPAAVMTAMQGMLAAYTQLRHLAEESALLDKLAPVETTNVILALGRKVRRELPLCSQMGHA
jgi:hypothetical protein